MIFLTSPGKTYSVNSVGGCTISAGGTTLATIPANVQTTFIAPEEEVLVSDNNAIIVEVTGVGAGGSGSTGGSGGSGGPIDLTGVALLEGGNTFTGDQIINGDLTVSGDVTAEGEYIGAEVIETTDATITPEAGKYYKYTGTEDTITVVAPVWIGYATISYLETAEPVDLQGVTWSPAKPSLTGAGPFVYTLACSEPGRVLASAMNYSVATAEAIQAVAPIDWGGEDGNAAVSNGNNYQLAVGQGARVSGVSGTAVGAYAKTVTNHGTAYGYDSVSNGIYSVALGYDVDSTGEYAVALGSKSKSKKPTALTIGVQFTETVNGQNVTNYCETQGTGSITIGAGANTLNNGDTESSNSITIGCKASNTAADSVVIGAQAKGTHTSSIVIGVEAKANEYSVSVGKSASTGGLAVAVGGGASASYTGNAIGYGAANVGAGFAGGYYAYASTNSVAVGMSARAGATQTVVLGSQANITNTTNADNTVTQSENTIVVGYGATASAPNAVVMGAGASTAGADSIVMGAGASGGQSDVIIGAGATGNYEAVSLGKNVKTNRYGIAIGSGAWTKGMQGVTVGLVATATNCVAIGCYAASGEDAIAVGRSATASKKSTIALGNGAKVNDYGATVIRSTAEDGTITQLYFSGANTPLANAYEDGEAMMGYVVKDSAGNVMTDAEGNAMVGTQKLSVLFPNNRGENAFTPAALNLDDEYTPKPMFRPSDLDLPVEEPTEEPEDITINIPEPTIPEPEPYTPLPVYPIVEPEDITTNLTEPEPYTPLPVYPIVEQDIPSEV